MSPLPSLKRNFLFNGFITAQNAFFPVISFAYLSRILGPEFLGKINFISSLAAYFTILASLALPLYGTRAIAKSRGNRGELDRVFSELFALQAGATALTCALYASLYFLVPRLREDARLFAWAGAGILAGAASVDWLFSGLEKYGTLFYRDAVTKCASLALLFLLIRGAEDYHKFLAIGAAVGGAAGAWGLLQARRSAHLQWNGIAPASHLHSIFVMCAGTLTSGIYAYLDNVVVGILTDDRSVGLYSTATRANRMVIVFLTSLAAIVIPRLSFYSHHNMGAEYRQVASKSIRFILMAAFPVSAVFAALAPQILNLLAGGEFIKASAAMRISVPLIVSSGFANYMAFHVLFPHGGEKTVVAATAAAALASVALNILLLPRYGIEGAAATTVLAQLLCCLVLLAGIRRRGLPFHPWAGSGTYLPASAVLGLALWLWAGHASPGPKGTLLILAAAAGAYFGFLYLVKDSMAVQMTETALGWLRKKING